MPTTKQYIRLEHDRTLLHDKLVETIKHQTGKLPHLDVQYELAQIVKKVIK